MSKEFSDFSREWGFTHTMSSPYHSSSNGKAESAVKIAKCLFRRSSDRFLALLEWWNTPMVGINLSPCQRLFSRRTRGLIPVTPEKLRPATEQQAWTLKLKRQNTIQTQAESKGHACCSMRVRSSLVRPGRAFLRRVLAVVWVDHHCMFECVVSLRLAWYGGMSS